MTSKIELPLLTPNQITTIRLVFTLILFPVWLCCTDILVRTFISFLFALIFIADNWDGVVARRYNMQSTWGHYFDSMVDLVTYYALCIMYIEAGYLSLWFLFAMLTREFLVLFVKLYGASQNLVIHTSLAACVKCEFIAVPLSALYPIMVLPDLFSMWVAIAVGVYLLTLPYWYNTSHMHNVVTRITVVVLVVLFLLKPDGFEFDYWYHALYVILALGYSFYSAFDYYWKNREMIMDNGIRNDK